jgi:uncharacterized protein DUF481
MIGDTANQPQSGPLAQLYSSWAIGVALLIFLSPAVGLAAKTDIIILRNGDKITGEVKGVSRGKLDYNTDDAGRLAVEWTKVSRVSSPHSFEVEVASGARYVGALVAAGSEGMLVVEGVRSDTLVINSVVQIDALSAGLLQRMKAYLDVGFTFAKANQATTFNAAGESAYRGSKYGSSLSFESYAQGQESAPTNTRNTVVFDVTRYLPKRFSAKVLAGTEQNDELDLDLRLTGAALLGRMLAQSNSSELGVGAGLAVTGERFSRAGADSGADEHMSSNIEGVVAAKFDAFRFDSPSLDFSNSLYLYPSLTTAGRLRGEFTTRLKYELLPDFNVGLTLTDTFDSKPPEDATKNDFITTFTIGWSYRR